MNTNYLVRAGLNLSISLAVLALASACTGTNIGNPGGETGGSCDEELFELSGEDSAVADPDASSELTAAELLASLEGDYSSAFTWGQGYFDDGSTTLRLKVTATGPLYRVEQTQKEQGGGERLYQPCHDYLRFPVEIQFETADGGFNEKVETEVTITESSESQEGGTGARFQLDTDELKGSFEPQLVETPDDAKNEHYILSFSISLLDGEASGQINLHHEYETSDAAHSGGGSVEPTGSFGAAE